MRLLREWCQIAQSHLLFARRHVLRGPVFHAITNEWQPERECTALPLTRATQRTGKFTL